jgi:rhamnosyltransferase
MTYDLIVPTYKPGPEFLTMIKKMDSQTVRPEKIIITNTEQKHFDRLTFATTFSTDYKNLDVRHISKREFDHGRTRNESVKRSEADFFLMMTQDAMPVDENLAERLLYALKKNPDVAVAYARQVAREDSNEAERYIRTFNYPKESAVRGEDDIETLGIKAYYCSNVCAMYRRDVFEKLGGFLNHTIFNEDMLYAAKAVHSGYRIAYVAEVSVIHSHNYTCKEQYKRYFDNGVSHAKHPEVFKGLKVNDEGIKLVKKTAAHLVGTGRTFQVIPFYMQSACKFLGFRKGKHYRSLSKRAILRCTSNPEYWITDELLRDRASIDARQGYGRSKKELEMLADKPKMTNL